jgi:hypothetical protein
MVNIGIIGVNGLVGNAILESIVRLNLLDYNNLINLCIMVKNGGELFEQMLLKNIDVFDQVKSTIDDRLNNNI